MSTYGFLRVSTGEQSNEKFKDELLRYSNTHKLGNVEFVEEVVSGKVDWKVRKLGQLIENCKNGDVILVPELSRLGRSISMIYEIVSTCQKKGIEIHALKQNLVISGKSTDLQTTVLLNCWSLCAELERNFISLRTIEALEAKRKTGVRLGRPKGVGKSKLDKYAAEIHALRNNGSSLTWIAKHYDTTPITVSRWLEKHPL